MERKITIPKTIHVIRYNPLKGLAGTAELCSRPSATIAYLQKMFVEADRLTVEEKYAALREGYERGVKMKSISN